MGPEGNILANSSISTFKQELTHSAMCKKTSNLVADGFPKVIL